MFILWQEIYGEPTSEHSQYESLHGVTIVDVFLMNGELVLWCKSIHGTESHDKGYILLSGEMMVMSHHFAAGRGHSTFGVNRGVGGDTDLALSRPKGLIHEFVYPVHVLESSGRKMKEIKLLVCLVIFGYILYAVLLLENLTFNGT